MFLHKWGCAGSHFSLVMELQPVWSLRITMHGTILIICGNWKSKMMAIVHTICYGRKKEEYGQIYVNASICYGSEDKN